MSMYAWKKVGNINARNYTQMCKMFIALTENVANRDRILSECEFNPSAINLSINPRQHPEQWSAWEGYLTDKKIMLNYTRMVQNTWGLNMSVPAPYPTDFDADYIPRQR
jgi:hypothetical protein